MDSVEQHKADYKQDESLQHTKRHALVLFDHNFQVKQSKIMQVCCSFPEPNCLSCSHSTQHNTKYPTSPLNIHLLI